MNKSVLKIRGREGGFSVTAAEAPFALVSQGALEEMEKLY